MLEPLTPTYTADLFPALHDEFLRLLRGLTPEDWSRPTLAGWRVRDVAAHLLDGDLRKLSFERDGHEVPGQAPRSFDEVVRLIDGMNASAVQYGQRLSPRLLVELLAVTGPWVSAWVAGRPPEAAARFSVAWAGEAASEHWMDTGREYTERWHHQMQIRDAVGAPLLLERRWLYPLLDLSVRALPRAYASVAAAEGTTVTLDVRGDTTDAWTLVRAAAGWQVMRGKLDAPSASLSTDGDTAWRLFFNALSSDEARRRVTIAGLAPLAEPLLSARAVMVRRRDLSGS